MPTEVRSSPDVAVLIVAAGRGQRAGSGLPKQYRPIGDTPVLRRTIGLFEAHPRIGAILTVIHPDDRALYEPCATGFAKLLAPCTGAASRQGSCLAGLRALADTAPPIVLIHDAARPFASAALVDRAIDAAYRHGAAVPGLGVTDTVKVVDESGLVTQTPVRSGLRTVQTPQAFRYDLVRGAHEQAAAAGLDALTDDGAVVEWAGQALHVFEGEGSNVKLTTPADFEAAETLVSPLARLGRG